MLAWSASSLVAQTRQAKLVATDAAGRFVPSATATAVVAWGANHEGQSRVPDGLGSVVAIAAGNEHTVALKQDGTVVAWGWNQHGQATVPMGLSDVVAVAAGYYHTVALKHDGTVAAWGSNGTGQISVPAGLNEVAAIAAGWVNTVALKRDGTVVAWGWKGYGQTQVPGGLNGVVAIASGAHHTVALKRDGTVVAWGYNFEGQTNVPKGLTDVVAIAAGRSHTVVLKRDGTVVTWGGNEYGQTTVPGGLRGVVAVAAGGYHTVALKRDGTIVAWGMDGSRQTSIPGGLGGVVDIAAGHAHTVVLGILGLALPVTTLGTGSSSTLEIRNQGDLPLDLTGIVLEGPDADQFSLPRNLPSLIAAGGKVTLTIGCSSLRSGKLRTRLHIFSTDPETPEYVVTLLGTATYQEEANPVRLGGPFTYAPLRLDRQTGLILQRVIFTNPTGVPLHGLKLILSNVAAGVQIYSSSVGAVSGTYAVIYSKPIAVGETISFDLVSFDPKRRTSASVQPSIKAEALLEPEPDALPVSGFEVPLLSVRQTPQGPMLEWNSTARATYVVEYSDDAGKSWFSAVHRLSTSGTRQFWIDRGQPETRTKPVGVPNKPGGRQYRLKKF